MVMQPAADVGGGGGGSDPGRPAAGGAGRPVSSAQSYPRSNPSEHKLLTTFDPPPYPHPHPHPHPTKSDIQFQGIEASESKKSIGGLSYWAK